MKRKCDCHLHYHQVCDLCCGKGNGRDKNAKDKMPRRKKLIGSNKALDNAPINYRGRRIGKIVGVNVVGIQIIVEVKLTHCYECGTELKHASGIGQFCPNKKCDVLDGVGRFSLEEVY